MSLATRIIARLDIKPTLGVVKGVRFEGLRVIGDPRELATRYAAQGADELLYLDVTASLYGRNALLDLVCWTAAGDIWVPLTVGGGVRSVDDMRALLRAGADKVAINTAALARPALIRECAEAFGSQAVVVSIEAKWTEKGWRCYTLGGREPTRWEARVWAEQAQELGAGELLLTCVDRDGTMRGMRDALIGHVAKGLTIPVVASGGFADPLDALSALTWGADAVAIGTWLHRGGLIADVKASLARQGMEVRE